MFEKLKAKLQEREQASHERRLESLRAEEHRISLAADRAREEKAILERINTHKAEIASVKGVKKDGFLAYVKDTYGGMWKGFKEMSAVVGENMQEDRPKKEVKKARKKVETDFNDLLGGLT